MGANFTQVLPWGINTGLSVWACAQLKAPLCWKPPIKKTYTDFIQQSVSRHWDYYYKCERRGIIFFSCRSWVTSNKCRQLMVLESGSFKVEDWGTKSNRGGRLHHQENYTTVWGREYLSLLLSIMIFFLSGFLVDFLMESCHLSQTSLLFMCRCLDRNQCVHVWTDVARGGILLSSSSL